MVHVRKYAFAVLILISLILPLRTQAAEITAIDFNGNVLGQVISTGIVVDGDGRNIGSITADSLIVNEQGSIIGGVVPQGFVIGNDNRFLGKVYNDGIVRTIGGKTLGRALPNGLVIDDTSSIIGSVLYPGIVYSPSGQTIGRVNGAGVYTDLAGQEIGFVSSNGFAYRHSGDNYTLEGRLMSSKMIVSLTGQFIGSIAPTGEVIDFEGKVIGNIHANGYAYDKIGNIVGGIVQTGYAFDLSGTYLGLITFNGEVMSAGGIVGRYRPDGNIVNDKDEIIGFSVSLSATANDNKGKYLGRVFPDGSISDGVEVIGRIGAKKAVYNKENVKIGEITETGPIYDVQSHLKGQSLKNGSVISLRGSVIGYMKGKYAYDTNGTLVGGTIKDLLAYDNNNDALGVADINATIQNDANIMKVSPFGYVFNADGQVVGGSFAMKPTYNLEGLVYSYVTPNGNLYRPVTDTKLTPNGILAGKDGYIGGQIDALYALNFSGYPLGMRNQNNIIFDEKGEVAYKIVPGDYVVENSKKVSTALVPIKGFSGRKRIALNIGGDLLGYADSEGVLHNLSNQEAGHIIYNDYVVDNNQVVVGQLIPFTTVINDKCQPIGVVNGRGDIVNSRDVIIGRLLPNGQAISDVGSYIGYAIFNQGVIDFDGRFVGTVNDGFGVTYDGKALGCVSRKGTIANADHRTLYGVIENVPVINFDNQIIGYILANGNVIDAKNQNIGYVQPDGTVVSKSKKILGQSMRYKVAYNLDNQFMGMVQGDGRVLNQSGEFLGKVNFDGSIQKDDEIIGYALYDFYIYDENFVTYGYLTKDGTVLNMVGSKLGNMDRGFVVDKSRQVVARGNRDYIVRDMNNNAVGELQLDGNVLNVEGQSVGYLSDAGAIRNSEAAEIAQATPFQYYTVQKEKESQPDTEVKKKDWVDHHKVSIAESEKSTEKEKPSGSGFKKQNLSNKIVGIALNPDGDFMGNIYEDDSVRDGDGNLLGYRTPDGTIVDMNYNPIGIEEIKNVSASEMFIPENAFGKGNPYGIGNSPTNLGPGGGYGQGERYDPAKQQALRAAQDMRRQGIQSGMVSKSSIKPSSFTGYEEDMWPGSNFKISSWRVDMSEMILEDKPIPAVIARSIYGSDAGFSDGIPVTAVVERNVYSEEGRNIIIPAGSRLIGDFGGGDGANGISGDAVKMAISWRRLIRPDGSQFTFEGQTADAQGRAGALGYLDEQLIKKYTAPLIASAVENSIAYSLATGKSSTSDGGTTTQDARAAAAEDARQNFIDQMNQIVEDLMERKSKITPITYVPVGTRIIIFPRVDLWLNSMARSKVKDEMGDDDVKDRGLTETGPSGGGGGRGTGSVTYNGNYQENVQPASAKKQNAGGGRGASGYVRPANPQQQTPPASTNSTTKNNEVPDFI